MITELRSLKSPGITFDANGAIYTITGATATFTALVANTIAEATDSGLVVGGIGDSLSFFGGIPATKPTLGGSAASDIITALVALGLVTAAGA
jgi:hypothetical protein